MPSSSANAALFSVHPFWQARIHQVGLPVPARRRAPPTGVSLVVPAWNEEIRLPKTLEQYIPLLQAYGRPFEVIVVVDGATDRTIEVAESYRSKGVRVLAFSQKLGKGGAVMAGFRSAQYDAVGFLDADAPITGASFAYLLAMLSTADSVVGSRWLPESAGGASKPASRRVLSKAWNALARWILGLEIRDTQCGAKFFRRDAVLQILPQVVLANWAFDVSLLFHFQRAGFTIAEIPVSWEDDLNSKLCVASTAPAMLMSLVGIRLVSLPRFPERARATLYRLGQNLAK